MSTVLSSRAQVTGSYTTPARKFDISRWFPCGADKRAYGHVITKISRMDRINYQIFRYGAPCARGAPLKYLIEITRAEPGLVC